MKIMIFLEGTIFYTKPITFLFSKKGYVPVGNCIEKINLWHSQGNEIILCTYARKRKINFIKSILEHYQISYGKLVCREKSQSYCDLVESVMPRVLIEDDCKSIGGAKQMCITNVNSQLKENIKSIVVKEFNGIDDLPADSKLLLSYIAT